ncbi:MAG TPA: hypothetical protein VH414_16425 [Lichenihabitans sp.]|nr:hypothetical protein [Lichenihabitans sp.]
MTRSRGVKILAAFGVALMLSSTLAGCGRRGALLPPPDPNAPPQDASVSKTGIHRRPKNPPIVPPNQPFVLDPLL